MWKIITAHSVPYQYSEAGKGKGEGGWSPKGQEVSWSEKREGRRQDTQRGGAGGKR